MRRLEDDPDLQMPSSGKVGAVMMGISITALLLAAGALVLSGINTSNVKTLINHGERKVASVTTTIAQPTSYAGVKIHFDYYYRKEEGRVRVVITLPEGVPFSAGNDPADSIDMYADGVLPEWACFNYPGSDDSNDDSFLLEDVGTYLYSDTDLDNPVIMNLFNLVSAQGRWLLYKFDGDSFVGSYLYLGNSMCSQWDDDTETCLDFFISEHTFRLPSAKDRQAWGEQYDAKPF
jgi:hypothetical protein